VVPELPSKLLFADHLFIEADAASSEGQD